MKSGLTHKTAARAQVGLSYLFLVLFFVSLVGQGMGYLKINVTSELKDVLMLVMSFWFMRQRETNRDDPVNPNPTTPASPAGANT